HYVLRAAKFKENSWNLNCCCEFPESLDGICKNVSPHFLSRVSLHTKAAMIRNGLRQFANDRPRSKPGLDKSGINALRRVCHRRRSLKKTVELYSGQRPCRGAR